MPKATTPNATGRRDRRHNPLEADLTASGGILKSRPEKRKSTFQDEGDQFVDSKASRKILRMGQELADEDAETNLSTTNAAFDFESRFPEEDDGDQPQEVYEEWGDEEEEVEEVEVADLETFNKFFPSDDDPLLKQGWGGGAEEEEEGPGTNLADLILEKIAAHEAAQAGNGQRMQGEPGPIDEDFEIPEKVVEVYTK